MVLLLMYSRCMETRDSLLLLLLLLLALYTYDVKYFSVHGNKTVKNTSRERDGIKCNNNGHDGNSNSNSNGTGNYDTEPKRRTNKKVNTKNTKANAGKYHTLKLLEIDVHRQWNYRHELIYFSITYHRFWMVGCYFYFGIASCWDAARALSYRVLASARASWIDHAREKRR